MKNMLEMLSQYNVQGREDSSLFDLAKLMFCDLPSYLDTTADEEIVDEDAVKNFDALLDELSDITDVEKYVDNVLGMLDKANTDGAANLGDIGVDTDRNDNVAADSNKGQGDKNLSDTEAADKDTDNNGSKDNDGDEGNDDKEGDDGNREGDKEGGSDKDRDGEGGDDESQNETDADGSGLGQGALNSPNDGNKGIGESDGDSDDSNKDESDGSKNKDGDGDDDGKDKGKPCKSVIVEFAADTIKYSHEPFVWNVTPGQVINSDTIIAYCKQKNKILPVRSIFKQGVVRKDERDGGFWRCWKPIASRHIVIDCVEKDPRQTGSSSNDYSALYDDCMLLDKVSRKMQHVGDIFNLVTNHYMYVLYCHLIYYFGVPRKWKKCIDVIPSSVEGGSPSIVVSIEYEHVSEQDKPEVVFADFINNVYRPMVRKYRQDAKEMVTADKIKATKGNPKKLKQLAQDAIDLNNKFFYDCVEMYRNCHKYFKRVVIDMDKDDFCRKSWGFLQRMEFDFDDLEEDNFTIYRDRTYEKFVKEIGKSKLDYVAETVTDKRDGRYVDYHDYFNRYIGHLDYRMAKTKYLRYDSSLDSSVDSSLFEQEEKYDGDVWDMDIYDTSINFYQELYQIKEYVSSIDGDRSRDYDIYFNHLRQMGLETDTIREVDYVCDIHEDAHEFLGEELELDLYLQKRQANNDSAANARTKKVWAAEPYETISDYFDHISKEIYNNEQYFTMKYKSLLKYFSETHMHNADQRWKIAEEVRRFDELLDCMVHCYKKFASNNINGSKGKKGDYIISEIKEHFKEIAAWPEPSDYTYDPTHEYFEEHYTFLNIDEIEGLYDGSKARPYLKQGGALGDELQLLDYKDGENAFTGFVPEEASDFTEDPDDEYVGDGDAQSPLFGGNMMNPPKLIADLSNIANAMVGEGNAMADQNKGVLDALKADNGAVPSMIDENAEDVGGGDKNNPNQSDDDVKDSAAETTKEEDTTQQECSTDISKLKYWVKYFGLATVGTMMFLGCGIPLPALMCIPLPCIYTPLVVVPLNKVGLIIVIGIAIRGVCVLPIMLFVNMKSAENSLLIPITMSLATLMETMQEKVSGLVDAAMQATAAESISTKNALTSQMKMKKEYDAKMKALKGIEIDGKQSIIDNFRTASGKELKQFVTRLKKDVDEEKQNVSSAASAAEDSIDSFGAVGSANQTKTSVDNSEVSSSIR